MPGKREESQPAYGRIILVFCMDEKMRRRKSQECKKRRPVVSEDGLFPAVPDGAYFLLHKTMSRKLSSFTDSKQEEPSCRSKK